MAAYDSYRYLMPTVNFSAHFGKEKIALPTFYYRQLLNQTAGFENHKQSLENQNFPIT